MGRRLEEWIMIRLANPSFLLIGIIFLFVFLKKKDAFLGYSRLSLLERDSGVRFLKYMPQCLVALTVGLLIVGLARPQWQSVVKQERFLARDIILIMDLSYSMENSLGSVDGPRKIDVAKKSAMTFIEKRKDDRIGLLVFGDETFGSWPLTRDVALIKKKVDRLGSTFYGGTNLAQPFVKAIDHFREMGQSENRILVFLSDGEARITTDVKQRIITEIKSMGVNLYLLGIRLRKENSDILEIVEQTRGRYIPTESESELSAAFDEIDRLEPSIIETEVQGESRELYPVFILSTLCIMFAATMLRNTLFVELC
jgi:Ca-activated chloride channel family protein